MTETKPVKLILNEIPPSNADYILLNLVLTGIIPSIGAIGLQTSTGAIELAIVANQGNDRIHIVNKDGQIGTPYLVELDHDIASKVRVNIDGEIKAWAKKTD